MTHVPASNRPAGRRALTSRTERSSRSAKPYLAAAAAVAAGLTGCAVANAYLASRAERRNPPAGRFMDVDGVRLHYMERGEGEPLVLLHGAGSMIQDFASSGLVRLAAEKYRVIVFDRPGYGYSERPRSRIWTADAQAQLIHPALQRLGVGQATVLGHSWGASVAVALALRHPETVRSLILAAGYYYPSARADVVIASGPALPVLGDFGRYTIAPILGRLIWPVLMQRIFGPQEPPRKFRRSFPREMALRPSQLRAAAAEAALMIPGASTLSAIYSRLTMPVTIIAGDGDRMVASEQSERLHREVVGSDLRVLPGVGHMLHQTSTEAVMAAIDHAAERGRAALAPDPQ